MSKYTLMVGDCVERLKELPDASIDAVVTDPPYGLSKQPDMGEVMRHWLNGDDYNHKGAGFMGKSWDSFVPGPSVWRECFRVLKPGGHLLAFFGSRTYDIGTLAIRLAGFEVRDQIMWVYGSGFPKSLDVSKAIDKAAGAEREVVGKHPTPGSTALRTSMGNGWQTDPDITAPATQPAKQWKGWGTALKPAHEPIVMARKPITGTVAANVLKHGTGAINVDGCRVGDERWPANFIHDGSDEAVELFPYTKTGKVASHSTEGMWGSGSDVSYLDNEKGGSAARFFYCAKASKRDRNEGCETFNLKQSIVGGGTNDPNGDDVCGKYGSVKSALRNHHPTVKPTDLMRYLVRMVTPPNGTALDPFTGSGSTGKACMLEGFDFVGCELSDEYAEIAKARIEHAKSTKPESQEDLFSD